MAFQGFARLGGTFVGSQVVRDGAGQPAAADDEVVTVTIFGPTGVLAVTPGVTADDDIDGLYHYAVEVLGPSGFDAGECYRAVVTATVGGDAHADTDSFNVI
jgi:hypothetical protein